jgi:hypothetical protein
LVGEAKRKKMSTARFLGLFGMERENPIHLAESVWVLKGSGNFDAALRGVGWRSGQLSHVLQEMRATGESERLGVEWVRWPSGREQIRRLPPALNDLEAGIRSRAGMFTRRGNGLALVTFEAGQMLAWRDVVVQTARQAAELRNGVSQKAGSPVSVEQVKDLRQAVGWQLKVKTGTDLKAEQVAALVIDELEKMAANRDAVLKYSGRVMLTFAGLEKDEREAWDVPEVREVVRLVAAEVKWWPLMTHLTHAYLWIACCVGSGETMYLEDGEVYHRFDPEALAESVRRWGMDAAAVMAEAGLTEQQAASVSARVLGPLTRFVEHQQSVHDKVLAGQLKVTSSKPKALEPLVWRSKFDGVSTDDLATQAALKRRTVSDVVKAVGEKRADHFGIVLDRSVAGQEALAALRSAGPWWKQRIESEGVKSWEKSTVPYLVVWGSRAESVVLSMPSDSMDALTKTAIPICVNRESGVHGKGIWSVAVSPTIEVEVLSCLMGMGAIE